VPVAPVPVLPDVIVSHAALETAVQPQVVPFVVIDTLPVPPVAAKVAVAGVSAMTAHAAASCVTVCTCAPAVIVAVREEAFGFEDTLYATVPLAPVPVPPEVIESHAALETAVHVQVGPLVVRVKELVPPVAVNVAEFEEKPVTEQPAPSCETVWVCAPAVIVAVRCEAFGFAETE